ncbi:lysoplasmalogenase family protein, partial [Streptomyces noursei]
RAGDVGVAQADAVDDPVGERFGQRAAGDPLDRDLPADLRIPVAGYSLLLTVMAFGALRTAPWAAVGGLLFLLSDSLIAGGIARWPQLPAPQFWIMLTYTTAQCALAIGVLAAAAGPRDPVSPVPRPAVAYRAP